jgi:lipopolysaccharide transport system permease protein
MLWIIIQSLGTVAIFYFVFVVVFKARWRMEDEQPGQFVLSLFAGLIAYNLFAEIVGRAPNLVVNNVNFVKKVVFPLDMLSVISVIPALITAGISAAIWLGLHVVVRGTLPDGSAFMALPMLAIILLYAVALSWLLAALGVYIRDVAQAVPIVLQALIYASPVLYPLERVPSGVLQTALMLNPLTIPIEAIRATCIDGHMPNAADLGVSLAIAVCLTFACHAFFMKTRVAFADVL